MPSRKNRCCDLPVFFRSSNRKIFFSNIQISFYIHTKQEEEAKEAETASLFDFTRSKRQEILDQVLLDLPSMSKNGEIDGHQGDFYFLGDGGGRAVKEFEIVVTDGYIQLTFDRITNQPLVSLHSLSYRIISPKSEGWKAMTSLFLFDPPPVSKALEMLNEKKAAPPKNGSTRHRRAV